jgi:hypothetical protein
MSVLSTVLPQAGPLCSAITHCSFLLLTSISDCFIVYFEFNLVEKLSHPSTDFCLVLLFYGGCWLLTAQETGRIVPRWLTIGFVFGRLTVIYPWMHNYVHLMRLVCDSRLAYTCNWWDLRQMAVVSESSMSLWGSQAAPMLRLALQRFSLPIKCI